MNVRPRAPNRRRGAERAGRTQQAEAVPRRGRARSTHRACTRATRCPATYRWQTPPDAGTAPRRHSAARSPRSPPSRSRRSPRRTPGSRAPARSCRQSSDGRRARRTFFPGTRFDPTRAGMNATARGELVPCSTFQVSRFVFGVPRSFRFTVPGSRRVGEPEPRTRTWTLNDPGTRNLTCASSHRTRIVIDVDRLQI